MSTDRRRAHDVRRCTTAAGWGRGGRKALALLALGALAIPVLVNPPPVRADAAKAKRIDQGKELFKKHCASCHGDEADDELTRDKDRHFYDNEKYGKEAGKKFKLRDTPLSDEEIKKTIKGGTKRKFRDPETGKIIEKDGKPLIGDGKMYSFDKLTDEEIKAITEYLRSLKK